MHHHKFLKYQGIQASANSVASDQMLLSCLIRIYTVYQSSSSFLDIRTGSQMDVFKLLGTVC